MQKILSCSAKAKINLGLRVLPKRADGFHNIESLFMTVDLADELSVTLADHKNTCTVECVGMELPPENTFTKAYKAFCVLTGMDCGVHVKVVKHIPSGGGLGGGSSDASSFIHSLDSLCATHLSAEDMNFLAGQVGSDVFFFTQALISGKKDYAALVSGRGEIVQQVECRTDFYVLLLFPEVSVSTKDAYQWVDQKSLGEMAWVEDSLGELKNIYAKSLSEWNFVNDFTECVASHIPVIREALEDLKNSGASFADMTGSGSTLFGIFPDDKTALRSKRLLETKWKVLVVGGQQEGSHGDYRTQS